MVDRRATTGLVLIGMGIAWDERRNLEVRGLGAGMWPDWKRGGLYRGLLWYRTLLRVEGWLGGLRIAGL